ncbi:membrane bound O-acyl transferase family-domain-containing protein [Aspergillus caelatus]|uniref:Membrane bound O-acyl transferase family-domain-containing protein n=2 Tax=Aspergillus subgen. Circumdati TaxID=2720871 RepID=A0A5N7AAK6_9EURO|nr:membrane bound O-acyl transferase family-domain-containing protein [Aspergillus caelatus]KAE8366745.1 membrane bound O-acyl transferase family-domain-containing protein [Aspergillus caelatus]KAE8423670.1 membrane bound O-acyl transferase family-domain-containing protein [Aspergillus pseudocaelatus]
MSLNPISSIALQTIVVVTTIGFTPAQSTLRPGALVIVGLCTGQCLSTALTYFVRTPWASLAGGYSVMLLFQFIDIALLTKWQFPYSGSFPVDSSRAVSRRTSWVDRLRFGIWAAFNARCIGTSEQVRNIPASRDQGRDVFLRQTARLVLLSYLGLDILGSAADPELGSRFLVGSRVPFLRRLPEITVEEVVIRIFSTIAAGIGLLCSQGGFYHLFAFVSVLSKSSDPRDWPPFYGSLWDAYSLRRLWSRVWHQSNTHKFRAIARFLTQDVLRLPPRTLWSRYTQVLMVFTTSAFMHLLIDISAGISISSSGAMQFFCTQAFGVLVEDLVINSYCALRGVGRNQQASLAERAIGFVWVGSFLAWSLPSYLYPILYRANMGLDDSVVPVSIIRLLRSWINIFSPTLRM